MPAEHYVATPELRYVQRFAPALDDPKIGMMQPVLQQRWLSCFNDVEWRDVPLVDVDQDVARDNAEAMAKHFVTGLSVDARRHQGLPDYEKPPLGAQEAREADNVDIVQRLRRPTMVFDPLFHEESARVDMRAAADLIERLRNTLKTMARMCAENGGA